MVQRFLSEPWAKWCVSSAEWKTAVHGWALPRGLKGTKFAAGTPRGPDRFSQVSAHPILPNGLPEFLLSLLSSSVFFLGGSVLEIILQSRPGWAYYPARVSLGGSIESVGSHRVAQGDFFHHRRDECASSRAISARETSALGRGNERQRQAYRCDLPE